MSDLSQDQEACVVDCTPSVSLSASPSSMQDTFRILFATDNHLGYAERDPVRGNDSFESFEEVLKVAKRETVDLVLLGGDLFHENKPSRRTMYRTMNALRRHCLGDTPVQFEILSDQAVNFPNFGLVNYEDPNFNVGLPIFSIHGNHDDPTREGGMEALAALDLLSVANLVNYFGKSEKVDDIEVFPILMRKGSTKIAVYGLGNIRDERLNRMFAARKVRFHRPSECQDEWFNIFVVHQNRENRGRGMKNCVHESFIPDFIDLVLWGHEHECLIDLQESIKGKFYITQPGSSVATSLVEGEARKKQVGVVEIRGQDFRMSTYPLETIRPFILEEVVLNEQTALNANDPDIAEHITAFLASKVEEMIEKSTRDHLEKSKQLQGENHEETKVQAKSADCKLVLVRLKVEHTGFPLLNNQRFGSRFVSRVANPNDILLFHRRRAFAQEDDFLDSLKNPKRKGTKNAKGLGSLEDPLRPEPLNTVRVEDLISEQLESMEKKLSLLPENALSIALEDFVEKNIPTAITEVVDRVLEDTQHGLRKDRKNVANLDDIRVNVKKTTDRSRAEAAVDNEEKEERSRAKRDEMDMEDEESDLLVSEEEEKVTKKSTKKKPTKATREKKQTQLKLTDPSLSTARASRSRQTPSRTSSARSLKKSTKYVDSEEDLIDSFDEHSDEVEEIEKDSTIAQKRRSSSRKQAHMQLDLSSGSEPETDKRENQSTLKKGTESKAKSTKRKVVSLLAADSDDSSGSDFTMEPVKSVAKGRRGTSVSSKRALNSRSKKRKAVEDSDSNSEIETAIPAPRNTRRRTTSRAREPMDDNEDDEDITQLSAPKTKRKLPLSMLGAGSSQKKGASQGKKSGSQMMQTWGRARKR